MQAAAEELEVIPNLSPPPEPELPLFAMMPAQAHPTEEPPLPAHAQSPPPAAVQAPMMRTAAAVVKPTPGRAADQASYDQAPAPVTAPFTPTSTPSAARVPDMRMPGPAAKPSLAMHVPSMPPALPMAKDMQQAESGGNAAGKLDISFGDMSNAMKRLEMVRACTRSPLLLTHSASCSQHAHAAGGLEVLSF